MCVVSNIGDYARDRIPQQFPWINTPPQDPPLADLVALRREIEELKKLLKAAVAFDAATGQPECEVEEKIEFLRYVAKFVGIDLDEVFNAPRS